MEDQARRYMALLYSYLNGEIDLHQLLERSRDFKQSSDGESLVGIDPSFLSPDQRERLNRLVNGSVSPEAD